MLIQIFFIGLASWREPLLPPSSTTAHHQFQDQKIELAEAEEMLGIAHSTTKNLAFSLRMKGIKDSLNSQVPEVFRAACKTLESIMSSHETNPDEWTELAAHPTYQTYLKNKYPPTAASSQSKTARRDPKTAAAAARLKEQVWVSAISVPAEQRHESSREDEIRQAWAKEIKKLEAADLDDDDLEELLLGTNVDYHCQLGNFFESARQPEKAKAEYQKAVLAYWTLEKKKNKRLKKSIHKTDLPFPQFWEIYDDTVEKCSKNQDQYFVPTCYSFSGACDGLIEARYRMDLEDYDEAVRFVEFFEEHGPNWGEINPDEYEKKCKKYNCKHTRLSEHQAYYKKILKILRENIKLKEAYEALKAQNRRDFWTLGVGGVIGMATFFTGFLFLVNYFLPKDPGATDTNDLTNPFEGIIGNNSFSPGSNFSKFLTGVIANATFPPSAQPQNVNYSDNASTTMAPFAFSSTLAPAVQGCTDLAKCMLSNISFIASLNEYLLDPSCGSTPAQWLHNLTCALIERFYQYTQAVNMMCVFVKLQEPNWVGICGQTLSENPGSVQDGTTCLEPGPIPPVRFSTVNLEIHRERRDRTSKGFYVTKRQANPFVPTETKELTESDELTNTHSEELSPDKSATFSDTEDDSATAESGTRDDSATRSKTPLRKKQRTLTPPPSLSRTTTQVAPPLETTQAPAKWACGPNPASSAGWRWTKDTYPSNESAFAACSDYRDCVISGGSIGRVGPGCCWRSGDFSCSTTTPPPLPKRRSNTSEHTQTKSLSRQWRWELVTANGAPGSPPPRCGHGVTTIGDSLYVAYGATNRVLPGVLYDDVWEKNISGWFNITPSTGNPIGRENFAFGSTNSSLYIFGGDLLASVGTGPLLNDFNTLDVSSVVKKWTTLISNGAVTAPPARSSPASAVANGTLYVFGGEWTAVNHNDLWKCNNSGCLDITPAVSPSPRRRAKMVTVDNIIYLFGGVTIGQSFNDLWKYSENSGWVLVSPNTAASTSPAKRWSPAMGVLGKNIVIFGGESQGILGDTWLFDTETREWTKISSPGFPGARRDNANLASFGEALHLFGGHDGSKALNDEWRLYFT